MMQRRHGVEQVRRHPRPGIQAGLGLDGIGTGMTEANHHASIAQLADGLDAARALGRQRHNRRLADSQAARDFRGRRFTENAWVVHTAVPGID